MKYKYKCETCGDMLEGDERGPFTSNVAFTNGYWYHLPCARTHDDSGIQIKPPSGGKLIPETTTTSEQISSKGDGRVNSEHSSWYYQLFKHMSDEHGLILVDSELEEIMKIVRKMGQPKPGKNAFTPIGED